MGALMMTNNDKAAFWLAWANIAKAEGGEQYARCLGNACYHDALAEGKPDAEARDLGFTIYKKADGSLTEAPA